MRQLSPKTLRELRNFVDMHDESDDTGLRAAIDRVLTPKRSLKLSRERKALKKESKRDELRRIRDFVLARSGGKSEGGAPVTFTSFDPVEVDHFWGRAKAEQTVRNCWALARSVHALKTRNFPSRAYWLEQFRAHCIRFSYFDEAAKAGREIDALEAKRALPFSVDANGSEVSP